MTLNQLHYFIVVARQEHFRLAAQELNISQPSLSKAITNLEEELNIVLFERKGRNVTLTKYGYIFLEYAEKILDDVRITEKTMKKYAGNQGTIDIGYVFPLAAKYIPSNVKKFLSDPKNNNVTFNFYQLHTGELISGLKKEKYDAIFGSFVENEPDIQFVPILKQEMIIITPVDHPLSKKKNISLKDLESYPIIGYEKYSGLGKFTNHIYSTNNIHPSIIVESPDENAIASLVSEGFGIALVADVDILEHFKLIKLHLTHKIFHNVYMAYLKGHYQIPAVRNFISFIKKEGTFLD